MLFGGAISDVMQVGGELGGLFMVCVYMPVLDACHVAATSCWQVASRPSPLSLLPVGTDAMQHRQVFFSETPGCHTLP